MGGGWPGGGGGGYGGRRGGGESDEEQQKMRELTTPARAITLSMTGAVSMPTPIICASNRTIACGPLCGA